MDGFFNSINPVLCTSLLLICDIQLYPQQYNYPKILYVNLETDEASFRKETLT